MITKDKKQTVIADHGRHKTDTGSPEVQISILTARIREITEHGKTNRKDFAAKRGLLQMVGRRKRLLSKLAEQDPKSYTSLIKKLELKPGSLR